MNLTYHYKKADRALNSVIDRYWTLENESKAVERVVIFPDHCFDLIIKKELGHETEFLVTGIWNEIHHIEIPPETTLMGVNFYPLALVSFFNITLENLVNDCVHFDLKNLNYNSEFPVDFIRNNHEARAIFEKIESYFLSHEIKAINLPGYYKKEKLTDILQNSHWSEKSLRRFYHKSFGLSPKAYMILARQVKARHLLLSTNLSLVDIGLSLGFYDQAHFIKEFKGTYNITPSKFLKAYKLSEFYNPYSTFPASL